jgi:hypothetical protein
MFLGLRLQKKVFMPEVEYLAYPALSRNQGSRFKVGQVPQELEDLMHPFALADIDPVVLEHADILHVDTGPLGRFPVHPAF